MSSRTTLLAPGLVLRLILRLVLGLGLFMAVLPTRLSAMELIMFEQDSCEWCEVWNEEIAPVYPKTTEGKAAPLRRVDIFDPRPKDLKALKSPQFTPTFVLYDNGKEVGRIRGYPGEDFFWGMLAQLIEKRQKAATAAKKSQNNPTSPQKPAS